MLDPQAPLALPVPLPEGANLLARTGRRASRPEQAPALLGSLACLLDAFDFGREHRRPRHPLQRTLALEVDVPSFSVGPAAEKAVPPEHRGQLPGIVISIGCASLQPLPSCSSPATAWRMPVSASVQQIICSASMYSCVMPNARR